MFVKYRVGFDGQLIPGEVPRPNCNCALQIFFGSFQGLFGKTMHQVQINTSEPCIAGVLDSGMCLIAIVNSTQRLKKGVIETLDTNRQAINASFPERAKLVSICTSRVCLHGGFQCCGQWHDVFYTPQQLLNAIGRE